MPKAEAPAGAGVYIIKHVETDMFYVGSTNDLRRRISRHKVDLRRGENSNRNLQALYDQNSELEFLCSPTKTREDALAMEQELLDTLKGSEVLLNVAIDAVAPTKGLTYSEEIKQKMVGSHGVPVVIHGVQYPNMAGAANALGESVQTVRMRCLNPRPKFKDWVRK